MYTNIVVIVIIIIIIIIIIIVIIIIIIDILLYIGISQTLSLAACGNIYANKIVTVRHNAHYSAFVYSACTEEALPSGNMRIFNNRSRKAPPAAAVAFPSHPRDLIPLAPPRSASPTVRFQPVIPLRCRIIALRIGTVVGSSPTLSTKNWL